MHKKRDWHKFFQGWMARPHHRFSFRVWQWLSLRIHVHQCRACSDIVELANKGRPPTIGYPPERN